MNFKWVDYGTAYEDEIDTWMDDEWVIKYAVDESIKADYACVMALDKIVLNENYACKVVFDDDELIAVVVLTVQHKPIHLSEKLIGIDCIIVAPKARRKGYGVKINREIVRHIGEIMPVLQGAECIFDSEIDASHSASLRMTEDAGFVLAEQTDDGWAIMMYPPSALERYCKYLTAFYENGKDWVEYL
jgi:GNAT superfamily N-acetyltransferase